MIFDKLTEFSDAQSVAGVAGTGINCTNQVDTGSVARDLGNGKEIFLVVSVDTDIITAGAAGTLKLALVSSDAVTLNSPTEHASISLVTGAAASVTNKTKKGSVAWVLALPQGLDYKRYLGVIFTPTTTAITAGNVNAFLSLDKTGNKPYPAN